ncbi:MAG: ATP-binding cassette domain-containing protein [bacterium]
MIELKNLTKNFDKKVAVQNLNLKIEAGKITMLIGPSGCGKTTTLKMINRLIEASQGDILIDDNSIYDLDAVTLRRSIGYVIQETGLFPHMNVFDNIAVVPRLLKWNEGKVKDRVEELLDLVTLDTTYTQKYPLQLSGGESQRVGLARALAADPNILLMDEPFGAIDPINRAKLHESFISIQEKLGKTIVFVTHDINEAIKLGDKLAILRSGELIQYDQVTSILYEPENEFVKQLLGHDRNIKALVLKKNRDYIVQDGYLAVHKSDKAEHILAAIEASNMSRALAVDRENRFEGIFMLEHSKHSAKPRLTLLDDAITVDENNNLQETLSLMIEAGEAQLPVIGHRKEFLGVINLEDIFNEFRGSER